MHDVEQMTAASIDGLERRRPELAPVYPLSGGRRHRGPVDHAAPARRSPRGEAIRVPRLHQRLAAAVPELLSQVGQETVPAVMPDHRRWVESDLPAALLQSPAGVDVVSGCGIDGVEAATFQQHVSPYGHVAAGNVLGSVV